MTWKGLPIPPLPDSSTAASADTGCPQCHGIGVIVALDGSTTKCPCGTWDKARIAAAGAAARIPERYRGKTLATFKADRGDRLRRELREHAMAYSVGFKPSDRGLLLVGDTGCGKTHIAAGILIEVVRRGFTGLYCNVTDLLSRLRESYRTQSEEHEADILDEADSVDLLVFDDLGAEMATEWVRDRLYLIVNRRYENMKPVIVTTNCNEAELKERLGPRIVSRLHEMCDPMREFPKEDYRFLHLE